VWGRVFGITQDYSSSITSKDLLEVIHRLIQLAKLIDETEQKLRSIPSLNLERYLAPFPAMRSALFISSLDSELKQPLLNGTNIVILGFCEEKLAEYHLESKIEEEQLKELLDDVNSLYEQVKASSLHEKLKILILEQLEHIRRAIHEYRIRGVERLEEEMITIVGAYVLNKDLIENESGHAEVSMFQSIISRYAATVAFASHTTKLIEAAATYLPKLLPGS
jgi:hypothetical protein